VAKRTSLTLYSRTLRVVVAALLGSLLMPIFGISAPQTLPSATAAVSNGSIGLSSGGAGRFSFATPLPVHQGLTWESWIKFSTIASTNGIFASCVNVASTDNCPTWFSDTHVLYLNSGKFRISGIPGVNWCEATSSQAITANTWIHFALVIPAFSSGSNVTATVYVGGRSAASCSGTATSTGTQVKGVVVGGSGNSATANRIDIGPTRISKIVRYSSQFLPQPTFPTSGDANIWAVSNTQYDSDNSAACTALSDPNSKTLTFTTFATYQLYNFGATSGSHGGAGTATVTCNVSSLVASDIATLSSASIKGETPTLGTPNSTLGSVVAGQVSLNAAQASGGLTSTFTRTDSGSTLNKVVKFASGANTANFDSAASFSNPSTDTISFGDFFIIKITAADGITINFYRINVTVIRSQQSASLSLDPGVLIFRQAKELRAIPSVAGRVTFRANGKVIPGCNNKEVLANATVTCSYLPSTRGAVVISVTLDPTSSSYIGATTSSNTVVANRTSRR